MLDNTIDFWQSGRIQKVFGSDLVTVKTILIPSLQQSLPKLKPPETDKRFSYLSIKDNVLVSSSYSSILLSSYLPQIALVSLSQSPVLTFLILFSTRFSPREVRLLKIIL
jgi:hypothetical protein